MLSKSIRGILLLLVSVALLSCSAFPANSGPQTSTEKTYLGDNALAFVTGSIFNQPIDPSGKLFLSSWLDPDGSDFDQYIWDDFTLQSNETITEIQWYGGYDPLRNSMGGPVVDFTVALYPSIAAGTEPAVANPPLVTYQTGGNASETTIGQVNGIPMYAYAFSLPVSFTASAGVKYWVHIKAFQHGSGPDWGLAAGTGGNGSHYRWGSGSGGDSGFRSIPGDAAFTLLGPVPDIPTIFLSNTIVDENQPINTVVGELTAANSDPNATFTFSLSCAIPVTDDGFFNILGTSLQTSASFDFETKSIYNICIRVTDQGGLTLDQNFIVTVNNLNEVPTDISLSNNTVDENRPINTVVGVLTATDPDAGATFTFSLTCAAAGADDGSFNILGTNLQTSAIFDFEAKSTYNICIRVTDQGALTLDKNFIVTVNNVNEMPTGISLSNTIVNENQPINTIVGALTAADPDAGATFTFSLSCLVAGPDNGSFNILGTNLQTSAILDFEAKSTYNVCIRVTDQSGLSFDKNFVVTANNVNETPTGISLSNTIVNENQQVNTVVGGLTAIDPDAGGMFTFSLSCAVAGADDGFFNILGTNLQTSAIFDFETKSTYNICIRVADQGGLTFDKNFVITVNNLSENTAPTDLSLSNTTVDENRPISTVIGALAATDPDAGATFTFSLTCAIAGAEDGSFNIFGVNLLTSATFDFETKSTYNICIRVMDQGGLTFDKNFVITVNNVNEAPTNISLSNSTVDENQSVPTVVGALTANDPDTGATFTFSLACAIAGADDGSFNILGTSLRTSATFDFETKSAYNICIRVTDQGGLSFDKNFVVTVNNIEELTNTPGKVTGGGNIDLSNKKATFGFVVQYAAGATSPSGNLTFMDHSVKLSLKASSFTLLSINDNHARITGYATVNGVSNISFTLDVYDQGEPGTADIFMIQIPEMNGYSIGGVITGGNIQVKMR